MCGRYASFLPPEALRALFQTTNALTNHKPSWNVAPTTPGLVVRRHPESGERHLDELRWGFVPHYARDLKSTPRPINARAETVPTSGMFRAALASRRCLVPADAFYEWNATPGGKQPYAVARANGQPLAFAGLWSGWRAPDGEVLRTYAIITTTANDPMGWLHERMPVVLEPSDWPAWLGEAGADPVRLMRPAAPDVLRMWKVSRDVNSVRNNGPDLLAEV